MNTEQNIELVFVFPVPPGPVRNIFSPFVSVKCKELFFRKDTGIY